MLYIPNEFFGLPQSFFFSFRSFLSIFIHTEHLPQVIFLSRRSYYILSHWSVHLFSHRFFFCDFWKSERSHSFIHQQSGASPFYDAKLYTYWKEFASWSVCVPPRNKLVTHRHLGEGVLLLVGNCNWRRRCPMSHVMYYRHVIAHCHVMSCHRP